MASKINFTNAVQNRVQETLTQLQQKKWVINREDLADHLLEIDVVEATIAIFRKHIQNMDSENQTLVLPSIEKLESKIDFCKKIVDYIQSESTELDPRVSHVKNKLDRCDLEKIENWTFWLQNLSEKSPNPVTNQGICETLRRLKEIRIQMLSIQKEIETCDIQYDLLLKQYPSNPNNHLHFNKGKEQVSIDFFIKMLDPSDEDKIECIDAEFIRGIISEGHACASNDPNIKPFSDFELNCNADLLRVELEQDHSLLPTNPSFERLESCLNALLEAKHKHQLSNICALLRFNDKHLELAIDKKDIIYLFNQEGDKLRDFLPYIMAFGTTKQATHTLLKRLNDPINGTINFIAACNPNEFSKNLPHVILDNPVKVPTLEDVASPLFFLQQMIEQLTPCTQDGYDAALEILTQLNFEGHTFNSPINGDRDREFVDRIFFHLYHIQNKDRPSAINRRDNQWGSTAFQSDQLSTAQEKLRAVQRLQVEAILFILTRVDFDQQRDAIPIRLLFDALEKLQMHPNDLPENQKNLAHSLFGNLYRTYLAAWEKNREMIHPHDPSFNRDFGRNAFLSANSIPAEFKVKAIQELALSLKKTWRL